MEGISAAWVYPIILLAGALQAWGPPMNSVLRNSLTNPWLASLISAGHLPLGSAMLLPSASSANGRRH
jgi:uncharacterized membrane protein YdcZ (DUF606 family)